MPHHLQNLRNRSLRSCACSFMRVSCGACFPDNRVTLTRIASPFRLETESMKQTTNHRPPAARSPTPARSTHSAQDLNPGLTIMIPLR